MKNVTVFLFPDYAPEIFADADGEFYDLKTERMLKKKFFNGRICINQKNKRYGMASLRKFAVKSEREIECLPF